MYSTYTRVQLVRIWQFSKVFGKKLVWNIHRTRRGKALSTHMRRTSPIYLNLQRSHFSWLCRRRQVAIQSTPCSQERQWASHCCWMGQGIDMNFTGKDLLLLFRQKTLSHRWFFSSGWSTKLSSIALLRKEVGWAAFLKTAWLETENKA